MSALPADVQRATRAARIVTLTDTALRTAYPAARDGLQSPEAGFFETAANAATVLAIKASLIGTYRRRFAVQVAGEIELDPTVTIPGYQLTDSELDVDAPVMLARIEVDLEAETCALEVFG